LKLVALTHPHQACGGGDDGGDYVVSTYLKRHSMNLLMMMVLVSFSPTSAGCSSAISIFNVENALLILDSFGRLPSLLRTDPPHHFTVI
jgi:hypothetical protein